MKKIIIVLLTICNASLIFAQTAPTYKLNSESPEGNYILSQNYPEPFNEFTLIEFTISSDKYVKVFVIDSSGKIIETLVDGEVENGVHNVIYKPTEKLLNGVYTYCMEIYNENDSKLIYSEKKELRYDKGNIVLFKK